MNFHYIVPMGIVLKYATNEDLISALGGREIPYECLILEARMFFIKYSWKLEVGI